jgi:apolipoprotein D and lipocalin family protein
MSTFWNLIGCKKIDVTPVSNFDLNRYLGVWQEIARFDHRFERGLTDVQAEYRLKEDGTIEVLNSGFDSLTGNRKHIVGRAKTTKISGCLKVAFFWNFYADYRVLALGDDYEWALVSSGRRGRYLWILARADNLRKEALDAILAEIERRGFKAKKLRYC